MGIFVGWIVLKRWLTLAAVLLCLLAVFILPRFPAPIGYLALLGPVILVTAIFYDGGALFGQRISARVRLAWALWMGFSALVLIGGVVLAGSNTALFIAGVAAFVVLAMAGTIAMMVIYTRRLREERSAPASGMAVEAERPGK